MSAQLKECQLCIKDRVAEGMEPIQLVALPRRTSKKKLAVKICPVCDSDFSLKGVS